MAGFLAIAPAPTDETPGTQWERDLSGAIRAPDGERERKYSCASVCLPGGFGTLDQMFEAAMLIQCGKVGPFPLVLIGTRYWRNLLELTYDMLDAGAISAEDTGFAFIANSPAHAVEMIIASQPIEAVGRLSPLRAAAGRQ